MFRLPLRPAYLSRILFGLAIGPLFVTECVLASDVVLIEEHWELHVGGPDSARSAPQVTMTMSPTADVEGDFFITTLNHQSYPNFAAGGIQVQRWHDEDCDDTTESSSSATLGNDEEVISWIQRLSLEDGILKFEILNGQSQSWGSFGGGELTLTHPTALASLNQYRIAVSVEQSGISYAGNRVSSLVLKRLSWQTSDGHEYERVAPIDIATDINSNP